MSATAATCWASTASAHPRRAARCWSAMDSPSTTSARGCENCLGRRTPDVTRVQGRRPRHVEFRSRLRHRHDHESESEGLRLALTERRSVGKEVIIVDIFKGSAYITNK